MTRPRTRRAVVLALVAVCVALAVASLSAPAAAQEGGDWYNTSGEYTVDVSDTDWIWVEVHGAAGGDGDTSERRDIGDGGAGGLVEGPVNVDGTDEIEIYVPEENNVAGWSNGQSGESDATGQSGNGSGSAALVVSDAVAMEAAGGGGGAVGGGGTGAQLDGGDGGGDRAAGGDGGLGGYNAEDGSPGEAYASGSLTGDTTTQTGGSEGDGQIYIASIGSPPELSNAEPAGGQIVNDRDVTLAVDVNDQDFSDNQSVTVAFHNGSDGSVIDQQTVDSAQTVSTSWTAQRGENEWYAEAEDAEGLSDSTGELVFRTPEGLVVRDEQTQELITGGGSNVTAQFYPVGSDQVIRRSTDDGSIDLAGLPSTGSIVVDLNANGYYPRTTLLTDISEQRSAYLLNDSVSTVRPAFRIVDRTQSFPADDSRLIVKRPISSDNDTADFVTIVGDTFGANERVTPTLERDQRYRVLVESPQGEQRSFGNFLADEDNELVELDIGEIDIGSPGEAGYALTAQTITMEVEDDNGETVEREYVRISYRDTEDLTSELRVEIYQHHNESNSIFGPAVVDSPGDYQETVEIPTDQEDVSRWVVDYEIDRDGETITGQKGVGGLGGLDIPVSGTLLQVVGLYGLLLLAGLFGGAAGRTGAVVLVLVAWPLRMLGIIGVPWTALLLAGMAALFFKLGERGASGVTRV